MLLLEEYEKLLEQVRPFGKDLALDARHDHWNEEGVIEQPAQSDVLENGLPVE